MKILFIDVDGPLIPNRMYYAGTPRYSNGVWRYDPLAVDMLKHLLALHSDLKLVYNSSHNNDGRIHMLTQGLTNGLNLHDFHYDAITNYPLTTLRRLDAISEWLTQHPDITKWAVLDDAEIAHPNAVRINFHTGIMFEDFEMVLKLLKD